MVKKILCFLFALIFIAGIVPANLVLAQGEEVIGDEEKPVEEKFTPIERVDMRTENSKTTQIGTNTFSLDTSIGAVNYKDDYTNVSEQWKTIDLIPTIDKDGNISVTKAPYELTIKGLEVFVKDKKTGATTTLSLSDLGEGLTSSKVSTPVLDTSIKGLATAKNIATDTDLEISWENSRIRYTRILKSSSAPVTAKYSIAETGTTKIALTAQAMDSKTAEDKSVAVTYENKDGFLTETIDSKIAITYPLRIDPTLDIKPPAGSSEILFNWLPSPGVSNGSLGNPTFPMGKYGTNVPYSGTLRLTENAIPNGSYISNAYIRYTAYENATNDTVNVRFYLQRNDSSVITTFAEFFSETWTNTCVSWSFTTDWTKDSTYDSPDLSPIFRELMYINSGLSSSFNINILNFSTGSNNDAIRYFYTYSGSTTKCRHLFITYTTPGVSTLANTSTDNTTTTLNASYTIASENITKRGFTWGVSDNSTRPSSDQTPPASYTSYYSEDGNWTTGTFNYGLTGLTAGFSYAYRAFIYDSSGYSWGNEKYFQTTGGTVVNINSTPAGSIWTVPASVTSVRVLVIAGGGGGGGGTGGTRWGGGGGGGGVVSDLCYATTPGENITATIGGGGNGGTGSSAGSIGTDTVFGSITAKGGGGGATYTGGGTFAAASGGGSGGGSVYFDYPGLGVTGGFGGWGEYNNGYGAGGGGGASDNSSSKGTSGTTTVAGAGGTGFYSNISGVNTGYGGGGGGGSYNLAAGGVGTEGGGTGGKSGTSPTAGAANTGGGGGGGYNTPVNGAAGGSGKIIISYGIASAISAPTVTTQSASSVEATTATGNGNITAAGGENCTIRGVQWDIHTHVGGAYANDIHEHGSYSTGAFTINLTSLPSSTTIYAMAYATNSIGTGYGAETTFLTKPAAATSVAATENDGTKVVITWTKATGATGYHVYRDAAEIASSPFGDVATADDAGGTAPLITQGNAVASDGASLVQVNLSLSGTSVANGTTYTYKVVSQNGSGHGADSTTDTGYRVATALTYQWNRSAADSDASYSTLGGFTSSTGADTTAPSNGDGRYYTCTLVSTNASNTPATATANRGYRTIPTYDIENSPESKAFGVVAINSTQYAKGSAPASTVIDDNCNFEVTNAGNSAIDINIHAHNFTGGVGWTLVSDYPATMSDAFDNNSFDTAKFTESTNAGSSVVEQNGRLEVASAAAVSGFVRSTNTYSLAETQTIIKVSQQSTDGGFKFCPTSVASHEWDVYSEADWYNFQLVADGKISATKKKSGAASTLATSGTLTCPYWMRMRVTGGVIYFEYANNTATKPNEYGWTELAHETWDLGVTLATAEYVYISSYNTPTTGASYINNFEIGSLTLGDNNVKLVAYASGQTLTTAKILTTSDQLFISDLAASATKKWDFKFMTGTFTDGVPKSITITITSVAH